MRSTVWKPALAAALLALSWTGAGIAGEVNWEVLKPGLAGATVVQGTEQCLECHEDYMEAYARTTHGRALTSCDSCHGPSSAHLEKPRNKATQPISFSPEAGLGPSDKGAICLQCHEGGRHSYWQGSAHEASNVSCESCHYVMEKRSDTGLAITEDSGGACVSCHLEERAKMLKSSHKPLREGKMACVDCHNAHGSSGPKMLAGISPNDTCYSCHADKRGPFLWEHAPVREDCSNCHDPHGSNNPGLLVTKGPFLCLSCHQYGGHVNLPRYNRTSGLTGQSCANCHGRLHGSNHPSGSKFTR
jgi:DmsE family decaheme c-type cytochrome